MSLPAQKFREIVFQILYSYDIGYSTDEHMVDFLSAELLVSRKYVKEAQVRVRTILANLEEIDGLISKTSRSYAFERIQSVERNILRMSVFELLFDPLIPDKVAIVEAMRLARKFSTKESASFVNAILDCLYKSSKGLTADDQLLNLSVEELALMEKIAQEASLEKKEKDTEN